MEKRKGKRKGRSEEEEINIWMSKWMDNGWMDCLYTLNTEVQPVLPPLSVLTISGHPHHCPVPSCLFHTLWVICKPPHLLDLITAGVHAPLFHNMAWAFIPLSHLPPLLREPSPAARPLARGRPVVWLCTVVSSALTLRK